MSLTSNVENLPRVVLLGGGGFIGKAVKNKLLSAGFLLISPTTTQVDLINATSVDVLTELLMPTDVVVMLAALTPDRGRDSGTLMKNLAMMENLCAALKKTGCKHFVYVSSDAVYNPAEETVTEISSAAPVDLYGVMHRAREVMAENTAFPLLILRPSAVFGPGDTHNAYGPNRFFRQAIDLKKIEIFGSGEERRDHVYIDDVADLVCTFIKNETTGVLNIVTGTSISFLELALLVSECVGEKISIEKKPRTLPVTHRYYVDTSIGRMLPEWTFTSVSDGINKQMSQIDKVLKDWGDV